MAQIRWNLEQWLGERGITRYELAKAMGGNEKSRLTSLYRMKDPNRIDLNVLATILSALRSLSGEEVTSDDLLEYVPDPQPAFDEGALEAESRAWLDAPLTPSLEPYDWGDVDPMTLGESLRYVEGKGWVEDG